jgi:23S rRNA-/tRNA-specific pseudouridylate synthase
MAGPRQRVVATGIEILATLLARLGESAALAEGRVFVAGRRASDGAALPETGSVIEVYAARDASEEPRVLRVEGGLAFVEKPAGIATEPDKRGATASLLHRVAPALGVAPAALHALSRLDVGVSGAVLLGLSSSARREVQAQRERGLVSRRYVAIAAGIPAPRAGRWDEPIGPGARKPLRCVSARGEPALTEYRVTGAIETARESASVLALDPRTGRTHQLRVHAAAHGAPLYGDSSYGGPARVASASGAVTGLGRIYLHAAWLKLPGLELVRSPVPPEFAALWGALGGDLAALEEASSALAADPTAR